MIGLGTAPLAVASSRAEGGNALAPPPTFTRFVIEGDSITSTVPYETTQHVDFYSFTWADAQTGITAFVPAQASRTVGGAAYNGDAEDLGTPTGNSLLAHRAEDLANTPHLLTAMIGTNDLLSIQPATYIQRLKDWAGPIRSAGVKIAYSPPPPVDTSYAGYAAFMAKWNALFGAQAIRNPANWSQWADYYIPMGEHPDFVLGGHTSDNVHPSAPATTPTTGQGKLLAIYSAAMNTLRDTARFNASGPYQSVWDAFGPFTDIAVGETITRRVIVSGLAWAGSATGVSVSGAGTPSVKTNGKTAPGWTYNGDVIDLTLTASASHLTDTAVSLTIGGETRTLTFRTAANVTPAAYVHGDVIGVASADSPQSFTGLTFGTGRAVVFVTTSPNALAADAVKLNGVAMTKRARQTGGDASMEMWDAPVAAGTSHVLDIAYSAGFYGAKAVSYGTVTSGAFASTASNAPLDQSGPHETPSVTVPANGIAVAAFVEYGGAAITPATVNAPSTLIDEGRTVFNGETNGLAVATRTGTGTVSFNYAFGTHARIVAVYGAA